MIRDIISVIVLVIAMTAIYRSCNQDSIQFRTDLLQKRNCEQICSPNKSLWTRESQICLCEGATK